MNADLTLYSDLCQALWVSLVEDARFGRHALTGIRYFVAAVSVLRGQDRDLAGIGRTSLMWDPITASSSPAIATLVTNGV